MQLLPKSLFGRLVLTFVSALAVTMLVSLSAQMPEREAFVFRISSEGAAHRLADQLKLMDQLPDAGREQLAEIAARRATPRDPGREPPEVAVPEPGSKAAAFRDCCSMTWGTSGQQRWR
jgi:hypothetical protein